MFTDAYKRAWQIVSAKPLKLWGFSLLGSLIVSLSSFLFGAIPALCIAVSLLVTCGTTQLCIDALGGAEATSERFFEVLKKENFFRVLGGMAWYALWCFIWMFVPIYGIYKIYTYRFVPYILVTKPEVSAFDALKMSMEKTEGKVLNMFLCDLCFYGALIVIYFLFFVAIFVLALIPILGLILSGVLMLVEIAFTVAVCLLAPIFTGLYKASFYESEIETAEFEVIE